MVVPESRPGRPRSVSGVGVGLGLGPDGVLVFFAMSKVSFELEPRLTLPPSSPIKGKAEAWPAEARILEPSAGSIRSRRLAFYPE